MATAMMNGEMFINNTINDILWVVHVEDCAALHVAALENPNAKGRYLCSSG